MSIKKLFIFCVATVLTVFMPVRTAAAPLEFIFDHYSTDDGLPHNYISDIHQDSKGFIWLSTWYGLSRYDGNSFVNYTMQPGDFTNLSHNRILSAREDVKGHLWVTCYDNRLYRFDPETEVFVAVPENLDAFSDISAEVNVFHCAGDGCTWIGLDGVGLCKVSEDLRLTSYVHLTHTTIGRQISAIYEDSEGTIYVVSELGLTAIRGDEVNMLSRRSDVLAFAQNGTTLFFADKEGISLIDMLTGDRHRVTASSYGLGRITALAVSGSVPYVGFRNSAVARIDMTDYTLKPLKGDFGRVRYLFPDSAGMLWIATERTGIYSYSPETDRFRHYEHSRNVMSYYADTLARVVEKDGRLFIKMNNYGFGYYDRDNDEIVPLHNVKEQQDCRFMNGVACYEVDKSGVLWMSTIERGLERVTVLPSKVDIIEPPTKFDEEVSSSEIRAMLRDSRGHVWVAGKSSELYRYDEEMKHCRRFPDGRSGELGNIYSIFEDRDGNIWLGTKGTGIVRMTPKGNDYEYRRYRHRTDIRGSVSSDNIYSIAQDGDGRLWFGTFGGGISMLENAGSGYFHNVYEDFPNYPIAGGEKVRYLHYTSDGKMLAATVGGLLIFDPSESPENMRFLCTRKVPGDMHSLGNNDIIYMFTDSADRTWLCTFGGGINRLYFENGTPRFDVISTKDGLLSNIVLSAVEAGDGNIWLATENGVSKVSPDTREVVNYTKYNGLISTSFSEATCARLADGDVVFGTHDNIYRIDPDKFEYVPEDIRLTFTGLDVDGMRCPAGDGRVTVPHDYSVFRLDFGSLNFKVRDNVSYSYMLKGYDKQWIAATGNSVVYSRIPPGKYIFRVSARMNGTDAAEELDIPVRVKASVWNSTASKIMYVLAALLLVGVFLRMTYVSMRLRSGIRAEHELNDLKVRFFTNISHELRTPLTLILGGIDEVSRNIGDDDRNAYSVNLVYKNARRMMSLVDQLLDIRKIVSGKMRLKVIRLDIVEVVKRVHGDFKDMAEERNIQMLLTNSVDSLYIWGDAMRLESLVYNLLSNAFKYTADGGKIEVSVLYKQGENNFVISVKDNGIGIAKDRQATIFEQFGSNQSQPQKGMASTGIGLSFCKEIVEIHGGEIWLNSDKDKGAKFYVRLPVDRDRFSEETAEFIEADVTASDSQSYGLSKYKVTPTYPQGAMKVLVVEDNAELRVYIYNNLINRYEVRDAANGKEALETIESGWMPDMIVTDLMMPVMDGIELVNNVRNNFNTSHIPIIMITAKHEDDTHLKAMKYGADGYLAKPFTMELLEARMENLLDRRKALVSHFSNSPKAVEIKPEEIVFTDRDEELIRKVMDWLEDNVADSDITVDMLAAHVGMGRTSMYNKIKGLTGKSPVELIQDFRLEKATYYLKSGQYSVSEISYKVGFSDPGYFSRSFKKHFGVSPVEYQKTASHMSSRT